MFWKKQEEKKKPGCLKTGCAVVVLVFGLLFIIGIIAGPSPESKATKSRSDSTPKTETADPEKTPIEKPAEPDQPEMKSEEIPNKKQSEQAQSQNEPQEKASDAQDSTNNEKPDNEPDNTESTQSVETDADSNADSDKTDSPLQSGYRKRAKRLYEQIVEAVSNDEFMMNGFRSDVCGDWVKNSDKLISDCEKNKDKIHPEFIELVKDLQFFGCSVEQHPEGNDYTKKNAERIQNAVESKKTFVPANKKLVEDRKRNGSSNKYDAWTFVEQSIEQKLLSPSKSKIKQKSVNEYRDNKYTFKGYVDAVNAFNVPIRHDFGITVQKNNGVWEILDYEEYD